MKILNFLIFLVFFSSVAIAAENPMFGNGHENSFSLYAAQGTGSGTLFKMIPLYKWDIEPMTILTVQYSQPITIFRLPARQNISLSQNIAYESDAGLSFFAAGISWDVSLLDWRGFYIGIGIGPYMRDSRDNRVDSRLVFGEKFFIGYALNNDWRAEFFTLHYSNGNFTETNEGFNYSGLAISRSF